MIHRKNNIYASSLLEKILHIYHGFTIKHQGNMQNEQPRKKFFSSLGIVPKNVIHQEQVHGTTIHVVSPEDHGKTIPGVDGLVYQKKDAPLVLTVHVGDCVPLLFADPVKNIIGAAHSGRKGTEGHIAVNVVHRFQDLGSDPKDIVVVGGPSICQNCYPVDLWKAISFDLDKTGVKNEHVDYEKSLCTFEKKDHFYSWRRKDEPFGEIMGYIGFK